MTPTIEQRNGTLSAIVQSQQELMHVSFVDNKNTIQELLIRVLLISAVANTAHM